MDGKLIPLSAARKLIPGSPCKNTVWFWVRRGLKMPNGERIRLPYTQVGGRIFTTASKVEKFLEDVSQAHLEPFDA